MSDDMGSADPFWQPEPVHPAAAKEHEARVGLYEALKAERDLLAEAHGKLRGRKDFNKTQLSIIALQGMMLERIIQRWETGAEYWFDEANLQFTSERKRK